MIPTLTLHEGDTLHLRSAKQGGRHEALMGKKKKKKKTEVIHLATYLKLIQQCKSIVLQ